ncbi:hypothetical protein [Demequina sp. NBRC 110056]|uniref:hypothetical protein n=1 Tax=Demequina sp. NBRC 110056 TaxID=1570345 RepID=UPI000A077710|nr:hypothetical protein [Demequina sp. NBRC 110056]
MYEINIFSSPFDAVTPAPNGKERVGHASEIVRYDEDFVKPALFLADRAVLKTTRVDAYLDEFREASAASMFAPAKAFAFWISRSRDPEQLDRYGIDPKDLLSEEEMETWERVLESPSSREFTDEEIDEFNFADAYRKHRAETGNRAEPETRFRHRVQPLTSARAAIFKSRADSFLSARLNAMPTTVIRQEPWDSTVRTQYQKFLDTRVGEHAASDRMVEQMETAVLHSVAGVMLDPAVSYGLGVRGATPAEIGSAATVSGAVELMRMVGGLSELPLDEVVEVREELHPYLQPFRGFLLETSAAANLEDADALEQGRLLQIAWEAEVAPAISDMRIHVEGATFKRNALDLFSSASDATKTLGMAVGAAWASGLTGIAALSVAAAAAPPTLTALVSSIRAKQDVRHNRAYFVHGLEKVTRKG